MVKKGRRLKMEKFKPIKEEAMTSVERVITAMKLKEPDRVPVWPLIDYLPVNYIDVTAQEMIEDPEKSQWAFEWIYHKLGGFDIAFAGGSFYMQIINPFPDFFSIFYLDWRLPGRMLDVRESPQLVENALDDPFLKVEDYDKIIEKGLL
jgi:hypothetical protein